MRGLKCTAYYPFILSPFLFLFFCTSNNRFLHYSLNFSLHTSTFLPSLLLFNLDICNDYLIVHMVAANNIGFSCSSLCSILFSHTCSRVCLCKSWLKAIYSRWQNSFGRC